MPTFEEYLADRALLLGDLAQSTILTTELDADDWETVEHHEGGMAFQTQALRPAAIGKAVQALANSSKGALRKAICSDKGFDWCKRRHQNGVFTELHRFMTNWPGMIALTVITGGLDGGITAALMAQAPSVLDSLCRCPPNKADDDGPAQ